MQLLIAELEPEHFEVERAWLGDFLQPQNVAIKVAAPFQIGDQDGDVVDVGDAKIHGSPLPLGEEFRNQLFCIVRAGQANKCLGFQANPAGQVADCTL